MEDIDYDDEAAWRAQAPRLSLHLLPAGLGPKCARLPYKGGS